MPHRCASRRRARVAPSRRRRASARTGASWWRCARSLLLGTPILSHTRPLSSPPAPQSTKHQTPNTKHTSRAQGGAPLRAPPPPGPAAHSHAPRPHQELALAPRSGTDAADATQRGPGGLRAASLLFAPPDGAGRAGNCSLGLVAELARPVDPSSSSLRVPPRPRRALDSAPEACARNPVESLRAGGPEPRTRTPEGIPRGRAPRLPRLPRPPARRPARLTCLRSERRSCCRAASRPPTSSPSARPAPPPARNGSSSCCAESHRATRRVRLVRGEGRGVST